MRSAQSTRWSRRRAAPWLLAAVAAIVMSPAIRNGWCHLDEDYCRALDLKSVAPANLLHLLVTPGFMGQHQPTVYVSHALDQALFGESPHAFHAMSVALWTLCAGLGVAVTHALLRRVPGLTGSERAWATLAGGLLFVLHPVHAENVAWLGDRKDLLGSTFAFAAFLVARRGRLLAASPAVEVAALALLAVALGAKVSMGAIAVAIGVDAALDPGTTSWRGRLARALRHGAPPFALSVIAVALWTYGLRGTEVGLDRAGGVGPLETALYALRCLGRYARHVVWPADLSVHHLPSPGWSAFAGDLALLAPLAAGLLLAARARPSAAVGPRALAATRALLAVGVGGPLVALLPAANVRAPFVCDRYLLLPSPWLAACAGGLLVLAGRRHPRLVAAGLAAALAALAQTTARRVSDWRDDETLWTSAARAGPDNDFVALQLAGVCLRRGRLDEAAAHLERAGASRTGSTPVVLLRATLLEAQGRRDEAIALVESTRTSGSTDRPTLASAWLAERLLPTEPARAEALIRERLDRAPRDPAALTLLGRALLARGAAQEALEVLERSLDLGGTVDGAVQAAAAALATGRPERAAEHAARAEWAGVTWYTRLLLGLSALALGDHATGLERLRAARRLVPPSETAGVAQVAVALAGAGALGEALPLLSELRQRGAASPAVLYDLARVEALLGRRADAAAHLREALAKEPGLRTRAADDPALLGLLP